MASETSIPKSVLAYRKELEFEGIAKTTAATNVLGRGDGLYELVEELEKDADFHGKLLETTWVRHSHFIEENEREGRKTFRADISKPHSVIRIQVEIVAADSESKLLASHTIYRDFDC